MLICTRRLFTLYMYHKIVVYVFYVFKTNSEQPGRWRAKQSRFRSKFSYPLETIARPGGPRVRIQFEYRNRVGTAFAVIAVRITAVLKFVEVARRAIYRTHPFRVVVLAHNPRRPARRSARVRII